MTEQQLRDELQKRLTKFLYDPQFQLFVKEYQNRQVAVLGAVGHPGVFTLVGPSETILELLSLAGGPLDNAADRVIFIPATPWETIPTPQISADNVPLAGASSGSLKEIGSGIPLTGRARVAESAPRMLGSNGGPLVIALRSTAPGGSQGFLNMPLRPGDVVVVPSGGKVAVTGWVYNPGSFPVMSGLSVLSAIGAAGGPTFAADQNDVMLFRAANDGEVQPIHLDLDKIRRGAEADMPVQGNDVIEVSYSRAKIVPYIFYNLLNNKVGGVGLAMPAP